jgi:membrane protein DedA with SNARE-associated domain
MPQPTVLAHHGLLLVFVSALLDQAGVPVPAVPVPAVPLLLACGALAAGGRIPLALLLLTATLASLTADSAWPMVLPRHALPSGGDRLAADQRTP